MMYLTEFIPEFFELTNEWYMLLRQLPLSNFLKVYPISSSSVLLKLIEAPDPICTFEAKYSTNLKILSIN